ncbi:MAG: hypothetical protein ACE5JU_25915 [Candidatus Binatia bacterium]
MAEVIEAEKFVLRDSNGSSRAELKVDGGLGTSMLWLADKDGRIGASMSVWDDGLRKLELSDENATRAELTLRADNQVQLLMRDKSWAPRAAVQVEPDGRPFLQVSDKNGKLRAELFLAKNDTPWLSFYERDKNRKFIAGMGVAKDGSVALALTDRDEKSYAELRVPRGGVPHMRFLDMKGKVLWSTPEPGKPSEPGK